ncbi:hypothetical protein L9F63_003757, partial [Diploptera punctata]
IQRYDSKFSRSTVYTVATSPVGAHPSKTAVKIFVIRHVPSVVIMPIYDFTNETSACIIIPSVYVDKLGSVLSVFRYEYKSLSI